MPSNLQIFSLNQPKPQFKKPNESTFINKDFIRHEKKSQSDRSTKNDPSDVLIKKSQNVSNLQIFSLNKPKSKFINPTESTFINKEFIPLEESSQSDRSENSAINDRRQDLINNPKSQKLSNLQIFSLNKPKTINKEFIRLEENQKTDQLEISSINDRIEDPINKAKPQKPSNLQIFSPKKPKSKYKPTESIPLFKEFISHEENPQSDRLKVFAQWLDMSVYERNNLWAQNKTKRIELQKSARKRSTMQGCTFQPKTSNNLGISPEKYGSFDITHMKKVFKEEKNKVFNSYLSQRTLKKHYSTVNKPLNYPIN